MKDKLISRIFSTMCLCSLVVTLTGCNRNRDRHLNSPTSEPTTTQATVSIPTDPPATEAPITLAAETPPPSGEMQPQDPSSPYEEPSALANELDQLMRELENLLASDGQMDPEDLDDLPYDGLDALLGSIESTELATDRLDDLPTSP